MLTKIGIAALLGTIGTATLGGVAKADEPCNTGFIPPPASSVTVVAPPVRVVAPLPVRVVAPPVVTPIDYHYGDGDRDGYGYGYGQPGVYYREGRRDEWARERRERERREHERREWLRHHRGYRW